MKVTQSERLGLDFVRVRVMVKVRIEVKVRDSVGFRVYTIDDIDNTDSRIIIIWETGRASYD